MSCVKRSNVARARTVSQWDRGALWFEASGCNIMARVIHVFRGLGFRG